VGASITVPASDGGSGLTGFSFVSRLPPERVQDLPKRKKGANHPLAFLHQWRLAPCSANLRK